LISTEDQQKRFEPWRRRLDAIRDADRYRTLATLTPTGPTTGLVDGTPVVVACSNDYLGLAWHPDVRAAARGGGAGGSRLISGDRPMHRELERVVSERWGRPATLFNSGYHANLGVLSTIFGARDVVASDRLNHASLIDGLRLGRATRRIVDHADPTAVRPEDSGMVLEGLYSMDGDVPDFSAYPTAPIQVVDEAHAVGALGPDGRGAAAAMGHEPDVVIGTFGKALGAAGAFVVGPPELRELLINEARTFIFTTAMLEPVAAMAIAGLHAADDAHRQRLADRVIRFRAGLAQLGWQPLGAHHVCPVVVGDRVLVLAQALLQAGIFARGIRWPTVPRGQERIRFTMSSEHTDEQLDRMLEALGSR
jgi:7-keto-8-aminopelargonate synthetase-like enzyme